MQIAKSGKEVAFLFIILIVLMAGIVVVAVKMQSESVDRVFSDTSVMNVLFIIEEDGEAVSTNVIAYYPPTKRAAMFDIPANTGLILKSIGRTDGVAALYKEKGIEEYISEIEKLTGVDIPIYLKIKMEDIAHMGDLLGGLSVFVPTPVDIDNEKYRVLIPSGSVLLDGDKILEYMVYEDENDGPIDIGLRKQKIVLSLLREINDQSVDIFEDRFFNIYTSNISSNLKKDELKRLLSELCKLDSERLMPQRVTGALKYTADNKELLFPFRDGRQFREVVKQALAGLASEDGVILERVYALEILNGTDKQGLAGGTSEIFQSFGYDVITVGNAKEYTKETILIDRIGNPTVAKVIADVIKCDNIQSAELPDDDLSGTETAVDFTLILGEDFNGYFVK